MAGGANTETPIRRARVTDIITLASRMTGYKPEVITGRARTKHIMRVRQAVYSVARDNGHSLPFIGRMMGGRDHTTVMHGIERSQAIAERDDIYASFIENLAIAARDTPAFIERAPAKPKLKLVIAEPTPRRDVKPKNDFSVSRDNQDGAHRFHDAIASGSAAFAAALGVRR